MHSNTPHSENKIISKHSPSKPFNNIKSNLKSHIEPIHCTHDSYESDYYHNHNNAHSYQRASVVPIANSLRAETHDTDTDHDVVNFISSSASMVNSYDRDKNEPYYENQENFDAEEDQNDNQDSL